MEWLTLFNQAFSKTTAISLLPKIRQMNQVFVVEAEDQIWETLVKALKTEGYGVITASDRCGALTLLQSLELNEEKSPFDLIILDWMLPKVDELELWHWLRHQGSFIPILVLIAKESEADLISALEAGADDYLSKPFSTQDLIARCRTLLHRRHFARLPEPAVLQFEEVSLYPQQHRVLVRGKEVGLSPKEFRLLELFISYPGRAWPRQQLFKQVWGPAFAGGTKTLDVHIRKLREKLELRPEQPEYITTVPRVGYRFG